MTHITMPHPPTERLPELRAVLELCRGKAELLYHCEKPWGSATFSGARHTIALHFAGGEAIVCGEELICALTDVELQIAGKVVADTSIVCTERVGGLSPSTTIVLEMLVLEDA